MAIAVGLGGGCGGGEEEAESAPLTKAQFVKEAEAICAESLKAREERIASWEEEGSADGMKGAALIRAMGEAVAPSLRREAEELKTLAPPANDEAEVTRMIEALSDAVEALEEGDSKGAYRDIPRLERELASYGLDGCP